MLRYEGDIQERVKRWKKKPNDRNKPATDKG
jgi:hypothetical protein